MVSNVLNVSLSKVFILFFFFFKIVSIVKYLSNKQWMKTFDVVTGDIKILILISCGM